MTGGADREPEPGDGPDYHAEHAAWVVRMRRAGVAEALATGGHSLLSEPGEPNE